MSIQIKAKHLQKDVHGRLHKPSMFCVWALRLSNARRAHFCEMTEIG